MVKHLSAQLVSGVMPRSYLPEILNHLHPSSENTVLSSLLRAMNFYKPRCPSLLEPRVPWKSYAVFGKAAVPAGCRLTNEHVLGGEEIEHNAVEGRQGAVRVKEEPCDPKSRTEISS
jgi:hypothetical protein